MQRRVVTLKLTDVSEVRVAAIISAMMRQYALLKRRSTSTRLHGATTLKTLNFILATVRT
jgi:hypothetical protein